MRVAVLSGRIYRDWRLVWDELNAIHAKTPITCIIEGGGPGADRSAAQWALQHKVLLETYSPDWKGDYRGGDHRNERLIRISEPELVLAFRDHGQIGKVMLDDLVWRARNAKIPVREPVRKEVEEPAKV